MSIMVILQIIVLLGAIFIGVRLGGIGIGFAGGTGSAWGAIVGAVVLGIISNILNLLGVDSYVQQIINGFIIVLAVGLDSFTRSLRVAR